MNRGLEITPDQLDEIEAAIRDLVESLEAEYGDLAGGYSTTYSKARAALATIAHVRGRGL